MQTGSALEQHVWLQQLVGEWAVTCELIVDDDSAPMVWESTERIRAIGEFWIVSEGNAEGDDAPFISLQTIGYDPDQDAFVGSWIDTLQTTMWTSVGSLDAAGRCLTMEAEGPSMHDPSTTAKYRDSIELVGPGRKRTTSSILTDGTWSTFMTAEAQRVI